MSKDEILAKLRDILVDQLGVDAGSVTLEASFQDDLDADSLVVRLHVPARAAYSALAGLRLLPLLADEWATLGRASRARGWGGTGPIARARQFGSSTFRLLVAALRRAGRLAVALDVRGLRPGARRTIARPVRWAAGDTLSVCAGAVALGAALVTRL